MPSKRGICLSELFIDFFCTHFSLNNKLFEGLLKHSDYCPSEGVITLYCDKLMFLVDFAYLLSKLTEFCSTIKNVVGYRSVDRDSLTIELHMNTRSARAILQERLQEYRLKNPYNENILEY